MKRPARSKHMGRTYAIEYVPTGTLVYEGVVCNGLTDNDRQKIQIDDGLTPPTEAETLIHENLHKMIHLSGVEIPEDMEEMLVTYLGKSIAGHIADNPTLWRYIHRLATAKTPVE